IKQRPRPKSQGLGVLEQAFSNLAAEPHDLFRGIRSIRNKISRRKDLCKLLEDKGPYVHSGSRRLSDLHLVHRSVPELIVRRTPELLGVGGRRATLGRNF